MHLHHRRDKSRDFAAIQFVDDKPPSPQFPAQSSSGTSHSRSTSSSSSSAVPHLDLSSGGFEKPKPKKSGSRIGNLISVRHDHHHDKERDSPPQVQVAEIGGSLKKPKTKKKKYRKGGSAIAGWLGQNSNDHNNQATSVRSSAGGGGGSVRTGNGNKKATDRAFYSIPGIGGTGGSLTPRDRATPEKAEFDRERSNGIFTSAGSLERNTTSAFTTDNNISSIGYSKKSGSAILRHRGPSPDALDFTSTVGARKMKSKSKKDKENGGGGLFGSSSSNGKHKKKVSKSSGGGMNDEGMRSWPSTKGVALPVKKSSDSSAQKEEYNRIRSTDGKKKKKKTKKGANPNQVFGVPLKSLMKRYPHCQVPPIIEQICLFIEQKMLDSEGIFRKAALADAVHRERDNINNGGYLSWKLAEDVITDLMKLYLRDLPDPLLTYELYDCFLAKAKSTKLDETGQHLDLRGMIGMLPRCNQTLLKRLVITLRKVREHAENNKMDENNLGMIFGPNLIRPLNGSPEDMLKDYMYVNSITLTLIMDYEQLFKDVEYKPYYLCHVKAKQSYSPRSNGELVLAVGDIILVTVTDMSGWWFGELNGQMGRFPASCCTFMDGRGCREGSEEWGIDACTGELKAAPKTPRKSEGEISPNSDNKPSPPADNSRGRSHTTSSSLSSPAVVLSPDRSKTVRSAVIQRSSPDAVVKRPISPRSPPAQADDDDDDAIFAYG